MCPGLLSAPHPCAVGFGVLADRLLLPGPVRIGQKAVRSSDGSGCRRCDLLRAEDVFSVREAAPPATIPQRGALKARPSPPPTQKGLRLTIDRETLAVRDRHLAQEGIRAGVT